MSRWRIDDFNYSDVIDDISLTATVPRNQMTILIFTVITDLILAVAVVFTIYNLFVSIIILFPIYFNKIVVTFSLNILKINCCVSRKRLWTFSIIRSEKKVLHNREHGSRSFSNLLGWMSSITKGSFLWRICHYIGNQRFKNKNFYFCNIFANVYVIVLGILIMILTDLCCILKHGKYTSIWWVSVFVNSGVI